ncbi:MAG: hypothetical protein H6Q43_1332, partial [Deltaproteobacteria bacterium]|nr:hypothetical protein [Deltaproteobacteria bacterium]
GVKLIELEPSEKVVALARLAEKDEEPIDKAGEEDLEDGAEESGERENP